MFIHPDRQMLWTLACVFVLVGCSSAPALVFQSRKVQPSKTPVPPYSQGGHRYYSFWSYGANTANDAHELAYLGVLVKQVAAEIGVIVEGGSVIVEVDDNGVYTYEFTSVSKARRVPLRLSGVMLEESYQECWKQSGDRLWNAYVKISVPGKELEAAKRKFKGRVALAYLCDVANRDNCKGGNLQALREAAHQVGLGLIEETVEEDRPAQALGRELDAAYVLRITVGAKIIDSQSSGDRTAYYAQGTGAAELVDTHLGKVLSIVRTEPMKDGGYCKDDALRYTVQGIVQVLCSEIKTSNIPAIWAGEK